MKSIFSLLIITCVAQLALAQRKTSYNNRLGLGIDATMVQLASTDVKITSDTGFMGYLETRGNFRDDFDLIYAIGIFNNKFSTQELATQQDIDLSVIGVEFKFLLAWKLAQSDYFSLEVGPALMINGAYKLADNRLEDALVGSFNAPIAVSEFQKTNPVNLNGIIGFSGGLRNVRLTAHYHYGFFNALSGTNVVGGELKGNSSFVSAGLRFYF